MARFQSKTDISSGGTPHGIVAADFNGDGKLDLAVANNSPTGTVTILLGLGTGAFTNAGTVSVGSSPYGIATTDFNGDGHADLVTANFGDSTLSILFGKGDGTFQTAVRYPTSGPPVAIRVADVNGDGFPDLLASDSSASTLEVFLGNGDGGFGKSATITGLAGVYDVAIGDFDSDGTPDLAVAASGANAVTVLHGSCAPYTSGVANAASGVAGTVRGGWVSIYGANLASSTYTAQSSDLVGDFLPTTLKGVGVQLDGHAAFVYFVSPGQINVVVPDDSNTGAVSATVSKSAGISPAFSTMLIAAEPGIFASSQYALAVRYSDGTILSETSSATVGPGDILELYVTGLGPRRPR